MIAKELISAEILPLKTSTTGNEALHWMSDYHVRHLPIVNNEQLLGLISEDDIMNFDTEEPIGWYTLSLSKPYVHDHDHIYEVMRLIYQYRLSLIPVIDKDNNYIGAISLSDVLRYFADSAAFSEPGSIIVLEMNRLNYSLAEISRLVEMENAVILSSFITSVPDSTEVEITLKINRQDIQRILATFARFDYQVKASFTEESFIDSLQEHYDSLMTYLNV